MRLDATEGFRYSKKSPYGIKVRSVCYPPKTLKEGAKYDPAKSGLQMHLEALYNNEYELWLQTMTQGDNRED